MRSSLFVILSVLIHALAVAAIAFTPRRVAPPEGDQAIEVQVGTPAEQPGVEQAPVGETKAAEALTPPPPTPVVLNKPEPPVKVAKAATRKTRVIPVPMEKVADRPSHADPSPAKEESSDEKALDPEIAEQPAAAAPAPAETTEPESNAKDKGNDATTESGSESDDTPAAKGNEPTADAELAHGGATQAGAVSYLDLKQAPGNKSPLYPMLARRENRQGQVELLYRVTKEGKVTDLQIAKSSGHKDLDMEAARAVALFKFVPGQEGWARHPVSFSLKGNSTQAPSRLRSAQTDSAR